MLWSVRMIHKFWNSYKNVCKNKNSKTKLQQLVMKTEQKTEKKKQQSWKKKD